MFPEHVFISAARVTQMINRLATSRDLLDYDQLGGPNGGGEPPFGIDHALTDLETMARHSQPSGNVNHSYTALPAAYNRAEGRVLP
jgi:hypothetical protein